MGRTSSILFFSGTAKWSKMYCTISLRSCNTLMLPQEFLVRTVLSVHSKRSRANRMVIDIGRLKHLYVGKPITTQSQPYWHIGCLKVYRFAENSRRWHLELYFQRLGNSQPLVFRHFHTMLTIVDSQYLRYPSANRLLLSSPRCHFIRLTIRHPHVGVLLHSCY